MRAATPLIGLLALLAGCGPADAPNAGGGFDRCDKHRSQAAAQRAWERAGRPPGADGDRDGRVCERLGATVGHRGSCRRVRRVVVVRISARRYPRTADHIIDAIAAGEPRLLHLDRRAAAANRERSLAGVPTRPGRDRDEYPPALAHEGGTGADIRYVPYADNRGAGSILGARLKPYCDGQTFRIRIPRADGRTRSEGRR
jgi:hypothetical protein